MIAVGETSTISAAVDPTFEECQRMQLVREDALLVTEGEHVASIYDLNLKPPIKSWRVRQAKTFTCPVVYNYSENKYISVHNTTLRELSEEETAEGKKYESTKKISFVLPNPDGEPIAVYENGLIATYQNAISNNLPIASTRVLEEQESIKRATLLRTGSDDVVAVCFVTESADHLLIKTVKLSKTTNSIELETFPLSNCSYQAFDVNADGTFVGITLEGNIYTCRNGEEKIVFKLSKESLSDIKSIAFVSEETIALTCRIGDEKNHCLEVVNLTLKISETFPILLNPLMNGLLVSTSTIIVLCRKGIVVVPYKARPQKLSNLFGQAAQVTAKSQVSALKEDFSSNLASLTSQQIISELEKLSKVSSGQVSERVLVDVFKFLIAPNKLEERDSDAVFQKLLLCPFSSIFLTEHLRMLFLPVDETLSLINMLLEKLVPGVDAAVCVSLLDWITSILDANFKQIVLSSKQFAGSLSKLRGRLDLFCNVYETIESLRSMTDILITQNFTQIQETQQAKTYGEYSVEIVYV